MVAADVWIFINLVLALLISVPAINLYTHGTHITVAHAMGSTIGINTMILLSSCFFMIQQVSARTIRAEDSASISWGFWIVNASLLVFFLSLMSAGFVKSYYVSQNVLSFQEMMTKISPMLIVFVVAGLGLCVGMFMVIIPALKEMFRHR